MYILDIQQFDTLLSTLHKRGYVTIGPVVRDGAIVLEEVRTLNDFPVGWHDTHKPGSYALTRGQDDEVFGYVLGPQSWKKYLTPPRTKLFTARRDGKSFVVETGNDMQRRSYAFVGVRPCELNAIAIHDKVFRDGAFADTTYTANRESAFLVVVNCTRGGETCFCTSMNTGPKATEGFDLLLTEVCLDGVHHFVVEAGSERGRSLLSDMQCKEATNEEIDRATRLLARTAENMTTTLDTTGIVEMLAGNFEHPEWDDVGKRCLACANCTMVCPTCFCSTVEDITDLAGDRAERWRRWDSCFTSDFTKIAGGNIRMSTRTRYRQWMMHKLSYWQGQFDVLGCVGCGRCITWCPAGIDITREARVIRETILQPTTE
jgi:ferredoxin